MKFRCRLLMWLIFYLECADEKVPRLGLCTQALLFKCWCSKDALVQIAIRSTLGDQFDAWLAQSITVKGLEPSLSASGSGTAGGDHLTEASSSSNEPAAAYGTEDNAAGKS